MTQAISTQRVDQLPVAPAASESAAILNVIERMALNPEIDPERIERFLNLKRQMDADAARRAFDDAVSQAKGAIPAIVKNRTGHNNKRYADFAAIASVVDPIITQFGLSYRFRTEQGDRITVTCILSHKDGHSEQTTLAGPPDASGSKNAIQAIGSTLTYLQRYTLVQALGIAVSEDDDGATGGNGETITDVQARDLNDLIDAAIEEVGGNAPKVFRPNLLRYLKIESITDLPARDYQKAVEAINSARPK